MKTSKVTEAKDSGATWSNDHGLFHVWNIKFENGDAGSCNVKNGFPCKFIPGTDGSYEYEVTSDKFPNKVKHVNPEHAQNYTGTNNPMPPPPPQQSYTTPTPSDPRQISIERQCCIKAAADLHKETGATADNVIESAKKFHVWITSE